MCSSMRSKTARGILTKLCYWSVLTWPEDCYRISCLLFEGSIVGPRDIVASFLVLVVGIVEVLPEWQVLVLGSPSKHFQVLQMFDRKRLATVKKLWVRKPFRLECV